MCLSTCVGPHVPRLLTPCALGPGPGLAFVVYPPGHDHAASVTLLVPVLFFFMLLTLGLDSQVSCPCQWACLVVRVCECVCVAACVRV